MGIKHVFTSTVADEGDATQIEPSDWNADHTIDGTVTLSSGVASSAPLVLPVGTLLSTSTVGAVEFDGISFYMTAQTSARQVVVTDQVITQTSAFTGTTAITAQKLFDASTGLNGAVTVGPNRTYLFETHFNLTGLSTLSHSVSFGFGGTAVIGSQAWTAMSKRAAASTTPTAPLMTFATAATPIAAASTIATCQGYIQGKLIITTSGTLIPQITRSAGTVAYTVAADSWFRIWPIGDNAVKTVGHWS